MHSERPSRGPAACGKTVLAVLLGGVWGAEVGYYDSLDDRSGTNPATENSQFRFLITYQRQLAQDFTGSLEYYGEWMQDYAAYRRSRPSGFPSRPELRDLIGLRLTKLLRYQTLKLSLFTFYIGCWAPVSVGWPCWTFQLLRSTKRGNDWVTAHGKLPGLRRTSPSSPRPTALASGTTAPFSTF